MSQPLDLALPPLLAGKRDRRHPAPEPTLAAVRVRRPPVALGPSDAALTPP